MKKWLIIASVLVLAFGGFVAAAYFKAMQPKKEMAEAAFEKAKTVSDIKTLDDYYMYNGKDSYMIIIGLTDSGEKQVVWVPEKKNGKTVTEKYKSGKTEKEIKEIAEKKLNPEKIISIKLGMEENIPLWEVTYLDESKRYNYDYYDFKTGEWLKYYRSI
ncbi:cell wall elongation regulator TseB-like domain-containing protein [Bacillus massiliglaciei]|uniref:cell wall elongation regulator TseB-like domain-containing protein n=1 Tax=Bacillus massiliglaciei TaxID=1816693 RepID=UPI000DA60343|nr:DUF5590 domain-containing protein [Bacillus massiliglaciei]